MGKELDSCSAVAWADLTLLYYTYLQSFGLEELISLGVVLCFSNLCHRGDGTRGYGSGAGSRHCHHPVPPWPAANLTDITVVSQNPKDIQHKTALARFKQQLPVSPLFSFSFTMSIQQMRKKVHRYICN